ncbi:short-chain dehydrogenase [Podospora appendiculata]|uniref:Short-chain dehydrogenase n=1 Tax=Podospora appendiculata TaxID=314037 RepID=A0AAE0X756_9PEZI|nr:short-chain dehydrogenase [Podospora appendiculata]
MSLTSVLTFLYSQLFVSLPYPKTSYAGKTIIVTGANVGLGKEAARHYARLGASKLILAVRSLDKGATAKHDIETSLPLNSCKPGTIEVWHLDMADYDSVLAFAARAATTLDRLDIVIANAGVAATTFRLTARGDEESLAVNVIGTFLLAAALMPTLKSTASKHAGTLPVFSVISSEMYAYAAATFTHVSFPDGAILSTLSDKTANANSSPAAFQGRYPLTKLLEVYGVRALAEAHPAPPYPVVVNYVNPGLCKTELGREVMAWPFILMRMALGRTAEQGSRTLVHAGDQGVESHGRYLSDCRVQEPVAAVTGADGRVAQERVWAEIVRKLEEIRPGVMRNF